MYTTFGAPSGALGASKGDQSGTDSRMSVLMTPLNGVLMTIDTPRGAPRGQWGTHVPGTGVATVGVCRRRPRHPSAGREDRGPVALHADARPAAGGGPVEGVLR